MMTCNDDKLANPESMVSHQGKKKPGLSCLPPEIEEDPALRSGESEDRSREQS